MQIRKGSEVTIKNIVITIYGQPDSGKTTLGLSAENPLLLDFDGLLYKAKNKDTKDIVSIGNWRDVAEIKNNDYASYSTIVIDTCGKALDYLIQSIIDENPRLAQKNGALTLQGYGILKSIFTQWLRRLLTMGKDVILLCHVKENIENESRIFRPSVVGGSLDEIMTVSTLVGFLHFIDKNRVLDFTPCESWYGKNSAEFDSLVLPHYSQSDSYMGEIIAQAKEKINMKDMQQHETTIELKQHFKNISELFDVDDLNEYAKKLSGIHKQIIKKQIWSKMLEKAESLGIEFDKESKLFKIME